jgi:hypothetical protein
MRCKATVNTELNRILKEAITACFKELTLHLLGRPEESHNKPQPEQLVHQSIFKLDTT